MEVNNKLIGQQMMKARKLKGLTVADVAAQVHFTSQSIVFAESGQVKFELDFLLLVCNALDITPNDLLAGQFTSFRSTSVAQEAAIKELQDLVASIKQNAPEEEKKEDKAFQIKDRETALQEIRDMIFQTKLDEQKNQLVPRTKNTKHW